MKSHTRRIWIFIGLKAKEIGIVLAWIISVGGVSFGVMVCFVLLYGDIGWGLFNRQNEMAWFGAVVSYFGVALICAIIWGLWGNIKKWIKSNWRKAGQIEKRTRGEK